jgi:hypothetical protein
VKRVGYRSDVTSVKVRSVLNYPYPSFLIEIQESHVLHAHFVSFLCPHQITRYGRSSFGGSTHLTVSQAQYPVHQRSFPSPDFIHATPFSRLFKRDDRLEWGREDGSGLTLSWLIGPIVTSHFLWWSIVSFHLDYSRS